MMMTSTLKMFKKHFGLLSFCEVVKRQTNLCFFFSLFFSDALSLSLSLSSLRLSVSLFCESVSRWKKKGKEGANFCSKARRKYRQNTRSSFTRCISTTILLQKEYFYAINDRNRYENVRAVSIQGQLRA